MSYMYYSYENNRFAGINIIGNYDAMLVSWVIKYYK